MTERYVHLVGADEVKSAGRMVSGAADRIEQDALNFDGTLTRFTVQLEIATMVMQQLTAALERSIAQPKIPVVCKHTLQECPTPDVCGAVGCSERAFSDLPK